MVDEKMAVANAILNTPGAYLRATMELHCVSFGESPAGFARWLGNADWERVEHAAVKAPAVAYRARLHGHPTVMRVADMDPTASIVFDDPSPKVEVTGTVMGTAVGYGISPTPSPYVYALVGPGDEPGVSVLWTAHSGEPIAPSSLPAAEYAGRTISAALAKREGIEWVRCGR